MKIKKNFNPGDFDFWYDITQSGYIKPKKVLESKEDASEVLKAIDILKKFEEALEDRRDFFYNQEDEG